MVKPEPGVCPVFEGIGITDVKERVSRPKNCEPTGYTKLNRFFTKGILNGLNVCYEWG